MRARESLVHDEKAEKSFLYNYVLDSLEQSAVGITVISGRKNDFELISVSIGFILTIVTSDIISIL